MGGPRRASARCGEAPPDRQECTAHNPDPPVSRFLLATVDLCQVRVRFRPPSSYLAQHPVHPTHLNRACGAQRQQMIGQGAICSCRRDAAEPDLVVPPLGHWQGMTAWLRAWTGACIDWTRGSDLNPWTWPRGRGVVYLFFLLSSSLLWLVRAFVGSLQQCARYMSGIGWAFLVGRGMRKKFMNSAPVAPIALLRLRRCRSGSIGVYPDGPTTIHRLAP